MRDYRLARNRMVDTQIAARGVRDKRVLDAMRDVPREVFVGPAMEEFAYVDSPLPIGEQQTISQPYIVAAMLEAAELAPTDRVLEVGAGSGGRTTRTSATRATPTWARPAASSISASYTASVSAKT